MVEGAKAPHDETEGAEDSTIELQMLLQNSWKR